MEPQIIIIDVTTDVDRSLRLTRWSEHFEKLKTVGQALIFRKVSRVDQDRIRTSLDHYRKRTGRTFTTDKGARSTTIRRLS